jgi:hypothetical protein
MLRTHTRPARGLATLLAGAMTLAAPPPAAAAPETPPAGDEDIPDSREPGEVAPAAKAPPPPPPPVATTVPTRVNKGSAEQGFDLNVQADAAFDAGNYAEAARLYGKTLTLLSENDSNHMVRSVVLANGVTSYEHLAATTGEVDYLRKGQILIQDYLRACKTKWGIGCDRYPETQEARTRLQQVMAAIEQKAPIKQKIPPEIGAAPGGKPYDISVDLPPAPPWIAPTMAAGVIVAAGGSVLLWHALTADKYGPLVTAREGETTDAGTDGSSGTTSVQTLELAPETKGKLLATLGGFLVAAGIGFVGIGIGGLAKHRRINRTRSQRLAVFPTFGRGAAGLALSGRF